MNKDELKKKALQLPLSSGVYIMKNTAGEIIYIGKAKKLKNRVKQYFDGSKKQIKVQSMVDNVADFDYILTKSDADAFLLENNLIKKHSPKYNILLKDDKQYPYIKIKTDEKYPRILVTRKIENDNCLYFGPYVNMSVNVLLEIVKMVFKVRTCLINFEKTKQKKMPCLHGQIGRCLAPCVGGVDEKEYLSAIKKVENFLKGDNEEVLKVLNSQMQAFADSEDYESAIGVRDKIKLLESVGEKHFSSLTKAETFDVFAIDCSEDFCVVGVANIKCGKNTGQSNYIIEDFSGTCDEVLSDFVCSYYSHSSLLPKTILLNCENVFGVQEYFEKLYNKKVEIVCPQKGIKKEIVSLVELNARDYKLRIKQKSEYKKRMTVDALVELQNLLDIKYINRIEGFDISNIQGNYNVSSMVVFVGGEPAKKEYRKFKIKTFEGANDFASMAETLRRRFERFKSGDSKFLELPDLILIDGGLGQLHSANAVLEEFGLSIPIISLAEREEEIYTIYSSNPIVLERRNLALRLLQRVRDEAHRFAITFHRNTRNKEFLSEFEQIEGVGKKTREKILQNYKSVDDLFDSTIVEIKQTLGVGEKTAEKIYNYMHKNAK